MYSFIYPKEDWTAAEIAANLQAFARSRGVALQVIPKHYGRTKKIVSNILSNTKFAVVIAYERKKLDRMTIYEINALKKKKVPIIMILPDDFDFSQVNRILSDYRSNSAVYQFNRETATPESIQNFIKRNMQNLTKLLKKVPKKAPGNSDNRDLFVLLGMLFFLLLMSKSK